MFLPISDESSIVIPLDDSALGQFRFLLHGYFFLDSGRRQIEGLNAVDETGVPADAMALRRAWNTELRDFVVLPLLPTLLRDALGQAMVTSSELTQVVSALARHDWFRRNRDAICREHALVRVLEGPSIVWRVVPSGDALRPLPTSVADAPQRIGELFGTIRAWAESNAAHLIVDIGGALSADQYAGLKQTSTRSSPGFQRVRFNRGISRDFSSNSWKWRRSAMPSIPRSGRTW